MHPDTLYKATLIRIAAMTAFLVAAFSVLSGCEQTRFVNSSQVVSVESGQLTIADENGEHKETHPVADDVEITIDGRPALLAELVQGDSIKIETENRDGTDVITEITAQSQANVDDDQPLVEPIVEQPAEAPGALQNDTVPADPIPADASTGDVPLPTDDLTPDLTPEDDAKNDTADETPEAEVPEAPASEDDSSAEASETDAEYNDRDAAAEVSFSGTISNVSDDQLTITDKDAVDHVFVLDRDTQYTVNGNRSTFADLKTGFTASVVAEKQGDAYRAKAVDANGKAAGNVDLPKGAGQASLSPLAATDKNADVEEAFIGRISSVGNHHFVIEDDSLTEHTFMVNDDTKYTLDGKDARLGDMKVNFVANVVAEKDREDYVAKTVTATSHD